LLGNAKTSNGRKNSSERVDQPKKARVGPTAPSVILVLRKTAVRDPRNEQRRTHVVDGFDERLDTLSLKPVVRHEPDHQTTRVDAESLARLNVLVLGPNRELVKINAGSDNREPVAVETVAVSDVVCARRRACRHTGVEATSSFAEPPCDGLHVPTGWQLWRRLRVGVARASTS
jgi:hypothetical protein